MKQIQDIAENLSFGIRDLGLTPDIYAEGTVWKFLGIQSKNRKEWFLTHIANMHQSVATVAFYDTLGPQATKFMC